MTNPYVDMVEFAEVKALHATEKAVLCVSKGRQLWVPKSQTEYGPSVGGPPELLRVTRWWAEVSGAFDAWPEAGFETPNDSAAQSVELDEASRIYRRLAFKYHPDRSIESEEFMKDLNELWQAISRDLKNR